MVAQAMHPKGWDFWEGKEALFNQLVARVWHRVSRDFPGEVAAAKEVRSILESRNEPLLLELLPKLTGSNFYQLYLAGVHKRLLHDAVANGEVSKVNYNPTGEVSFDPIADIAELVVSGDDRIVVRDLAKYLRKFSVGLRAAGELGSKEISPEVSKQRAEGVNEVRGRLIIDHLEFMGHDPMDMEYSNSKRGVKEEIRQKIWELKPQEFAHPSKGFDDKKSYENAFKHAWDWLRDNNLIRHLPTKNK